MVGEDAGTFDFGNEKMGEFIGGDGAVAVGVEEAPHVASAHHCALHGHRRRARRVDDRPVVGQIRLERPARPARRRVREEEGAQLGGGKGARACRKVPRSSRTALRQLGGREARAPSASAAARTASACSSGEKGAYPLRGGQ